MSHYDFNRKIAMAWTKKDKYWPKTEKITIDNTQKLFNIKAYISMANPTTRRTADMPLSVY